MSGISSKVYESKSIEPKIYRLWEKSGFFNPDKLPVKKNAAPYCILMPPSNANGSLHLGHAVFVTLQDILIRFWRMRGKRTLWLPGADHAGFETQVVFDKKLEKEGRNRFQIPREELYKEIMAFTLANKKLMENQLRQLGASCDWSRNAFTLDSRIIKTVYDTFKKLYDDGLIYRDERIINWCVKHRTSLSDLETVWQEQEDKLYYVDYKIVGENNSVTVATTRPETIPGDAAIAVHPKDKRYKNLINRKAVNPLNNQIIPIIADEEVDMDFGTGVLKITPAHDATDWEIGIRHNLPPIKVIGVEGKMLPVKIVPQELVGLKIKEARDKAAELLKQKGLLKKEENYKHQVSVCYKCQTALEPLLQPQWFVKMTEKPKSGGLSLRDKAVQAVKKSQIKFIPKRFEKIFFHWMKNLRDWNISRQIVWGIEIPAWYCKNSGKCKPIVTSGQKPKRCPTCGDSNLFKFSDVFDTWFSSGQWPFAALKYPNHKDYKTFYPTDVMETAYDILFFWVARMIMLGFYVTKKIPFKTVYFHGLVRDQDRQKMSKSKGNVIDPLAMASVYGTDALRMALVVGNTAGNDIVISEDKIRGYRNFATKIWNVSRFVLMNRREEFARIKPRWRPADRKRLAELQKIKKTITRHLEKFEFHLAAGKIYHYFWHTFADKIIEEAKPHLRSEVLAERATTYYLLQAILFESLKTLHPFMPFITEAVFQTFQPEDGRRMLMVESWTK